MDGRGTLGVQPMLLSSTTQATQQQQSQQQRHCYCHHDCMLGKTSIKPTSTSRVTRHDDIQIQIRLVDSGAVVVE